jgi:hypothetical protein
MNIRGSATSAQQYILSHECNLSSVNFGPSLFFSSEKRKHSEMSPSCKLATRKTRLYYNAGWLHPTGRPPVRLPEVWREGLEWISGGAGVVRLFGRGEILFFSNTSIMGFFVSLMYTHSPCFFLTQPPRWQEATMPATHTTPVYVCI